MPLPDLPARFVPAPPAPMPPVGILAYTMCSALGGGVGRTAAAIRARRSGLVPNNIGRDPVPTWIGRVPGLESAALPGDLARWECRNNRLAWLALNQDHFRDAVNRVRAQVSASRIAVVLGTSTSSIGATEEAYRRLDANRAFPADLQRPEVHAPHSTGAFVQQALGLTGPCVTVATACSSSAKVFAHAARLLHLELADAVVVGGVDSLCDSVLYGFNSLELLSPEPCRPFDPARRGINLGEGAGFALLQAGGGSAAVLLGYGESSDAHHMSAPHPEGLGARLALRDALARGRVAADAIDYINLHGTATQKNDEVEARVVADTFPARTIASSTKGWTGHTLGAAGIVEAVITLIALEAGYAPGTLNSATLDAACGDQIRLENSDADLRLALSLSFGFGGSNCVLLFSRMATT
jgi:3-oxoacyl-[acyl-carrier-protein] synthase I